MRGSAREGATLPLSCPWLLSRPLALTSPSRSLSLPLPCNLATDSSAVLDSPKTLTSGEQPPTSLIFVKEATPPVKEGGPTSHGPLVSTNRQPRER